MTVTMADTENPTRRFIRDARGRRFELTTLLGRGSFGKVYRAQHEETDEVLAAKLPLGEEDLHGEGASQELKALFSRLLRDEAAQLRKLPPNRIPAIHGIVDGGGAVPCLLMEFHEDSLLERLRKGLTFAGLCDAMAMTCRALEVVHATGQTHGNLKPGNIFFVSGDDGETHVRVTDPLTPLYLKSLETLAARDSSVAGWLPPEALAPGTQLPLPRTADAFAVAKLIYEAVVHPETLTTSFSGKAGPFLGAINKGRINAFRTALARRLQEGKSNPHVRDLLIKRASAFLARALSLETDPSPPYRFYSMAEMANRLEELHGLFHPGFAQLGSLISGSQHADGGFRAGEEIRFSLSFRCHGGIDDIDLITCMTYVRDLVAEEKVRDAGVEVSPSHDGHRFRFSFRIPSLSPGDYLVRVALAIKGSPGKPVHRDLAFTVHEEGAEPLEPAPSIGTGADPRPAHLEDRLDVDVIPPDLLHNWRGEPAKRRFGQFRKKNDPDTGDAPVSTRQEPAGHQRAGRQQPGKPASGILWSADRETGPSPRSGRIDDMDDKPARLVVKPERPATAEGETSTLEGRLPGGSEESPKRGRDKKQPRGGAGQARDDSASAEAPGPRGIQTPDRPPNEHGAATVKPPAVEKGRPRAPIGAAAVGRDAVRHPDHAPSRGRERRAPPRRSILALGRAVGHGTPSSSKAGDDTGHSLKEASGLQEPGHLADTTGTGRTESSGRTGARPSRHHRSTPAHEPRAPDHLPGTRDSGEASTEDRAVIPAGPPGTGQRGYYDKARSLPSPKDDADAFFRKGKLKTQQQVIVVAALSLGLVSIVALLIFLIFF